MSSDELEDEEEFFGESSLDDSCKLASVSEEEVDDIDINDLEPSSKDDLEAFGRLSPPFPCGFLLKLGSIRKNNEKYFCQFLLD